LTKLRLEKPSLENGQSGLFPPELIAEASRRLGWLGLLYAGGYTAGQIGGRRLVGLTGAFDTAPGIHDVFGLIAVGVGVAVYVVSRRRVLSQKGLLDFGLVFQVVGAFGIAISEFWEGFPSSLNGSLTFIPAECVWIVLFPLVVPNTPPKILLSSLLAASAGPAALVISAAVTNRPLDRPWAIAAYFLTSNYLSAGIAYVLARIVYRFSNSLKRAREIGSYELVERIGEGGMGEVWKAKHHLLARPAAIKLIRTDVLGSHRQLRDVMIRRFEREAQDTATLGSTHTIDVYDFGVTEEGDFYYVMELLTGFSLDRFVKDFGPMEPPRVVHVLRQVCHSLGEAHERGLIHRDIKPANIFLCRLGPDDDFVKVLDFGLVTHVQTPYSGAMLTEQGVTVGTPAYMAPEVALGKSGIDGRADIYSLGCVAYYLLTGNSVFSGETPVATVLAHVKDNPLPPSLRSEFDIPASLDELILGCLAKDPASRPATTASLSQRLAATVSADAWTPEAAHAWWELHRGSLIQSRLLVEAAGEKAANPVNPGPRCWPRLDRTPRR